MKNKRTQYKENMQITRFNSQVESWVKREIDLLRIDEGKEFWQVLNELIKSGLEAKGKKVS